MLVPEIRMGESLGTRPRVHVGSCYQIAFDG